MKENGLPHDDRGTEQAQRVAFLIAGFLRQTLSESEHDELDDWVSASDENMQLFEELTDKKNIDAAMQQLKEFDSQKALQKIRQKIHFTDEKPKVSGLKSWTWMAAASMIAIIFALVIFNRFGTNKLQPTKPASRVTVTENKDLPPGGNRATLILSDGSIINLNETKNGLVKNEFGTLVNKTKEGELNYSSTSNTGAELKYNTVSTPKGGQYKIVLPDGTAVWLNAASSIKYPVAFIGDQRVVELTGEGYFEVAKVASKKFIVKLKNNASVEVAGTHFNIMAYDDESSIETTLVEGSVNLHGNNISLLMKPGWQSSIETNGNIETNKTIDIESVVGWKNGVFKFKDATIEQIMRQAARWYNVDIEYKQPVSYHFNATVPRDVPVSKLFHLLEMTERVHFLIQGNKIIVNK